MRTADFDFNLPPELIAQAPTAERDQSRLLVLDRTSGAVHHRQFRNLKQFLVPGDLLVLNNTRVIPARLRALKTLSGGSVEILLIEENASNDWWVMLRPGKRVRPGTRLLLLDCSGASTKIEATVQEKNPEGHCRILFRGTPNILGELEHCGEIPLPPYIARAAQSDGIDDAERYQTVFAESAGSVAAPTAGLHFTADFLTELRDAGIHIAHVTLHVGLGTFAPVKADRIEDHTMHEERFTLPPETAQAIEATRAQSRRVIAVGTTSVRVLESVAAANEGKIVATQGRTRIFIYPPYRFRAVDALLTNFHLPCSTLLMLVSAFAAPGETRGRDLILAAYAEAIRERYRFFSYGDAMLITSV